jgi:hypothetical protein
MKLLSQYIKQMLFEADDEDKSDDKKKDSGENSGDDKKDDKEEHTTRRGNIKFTIWESPDVKVKWIKDNNKYQKIEYKYEDKDNKMYIDFLLGYQIDSWKLWIGKIGAVSYDDDPYCTFDTDKFAEAIVAALDKVEEFIDMVKEDPENYIQFYKD